MKHNITSEKPVCMTIRKAEKKKKRVEIIISVLRKLFACFSSCSSFFLHLETNKDIAPFTYLRDCLLGNLTVGRMAALYDLSFVPEFFSND